MISKFKFSLGEYVIFRNKSHQVISRLIFDHSEEKYAYVKYGQPYYLLSMYGPPVHEDEIMKFDISRIKNWNIYDLDRSKNGMLPRKPDSLFVEVNK